MFKVPSPPLPCSILSDSTHACDRSGRLSTPYSCLGSLHLVGTVHGLFVLLLIFSVVLAAGWTPPWPLTTHCQGRQVHCTFYRLERLHMLKIEKNKDVEGETVSDSHRGSSTICGDNMRRYHIATTAFPTNDSDSSVQKEHHGYALSWKQMPHMADIQSLRRRGR